MSLEVAAIGQDNSGITMTPIGYVRNDVDAPRREEWEEVVSDIVLDAAWEEATEGLEEFSHIVVVFWMHKASSGGGVPAKTHPRRRPDLPLVGLFATHSPNRPNPVGISIVRLLERRANVLKVRGLDAINGTPVLDIKGYSPGDEVNATVPQWARKL